VDVREECIKFDPVDNVKVMLDFTFFFTIIGFHKHSPWCGAFPAAHELGLSRKHILSIFFPKQKFFIKYTYWLFCCSVLCLAYSLDEEEQKTREFRKKQTATRPDYASEFEVKWQLLEPYCCLLVFAKTWKWIGDLSFVHREGNGRSYPDDPFGNLGCCKLVM
jgi:hypothetical protein